MRRWLLVLAAILATTTATAAHAEGERRFALIVGHNEGAAGETPLRFARLDAERIGEVLLRLGNVRATDMVSLLDARDTAETVLEALDALEVRIAAAAIDGPTQLVVYYSGHANQSALHLGNSALSLRVLDDRLQRSLATARVLILDACRSGSITRTKGEDAFPVVAASGYVVVTASAAGEDAAESDELQGSFFTHALISGLAGAGDANGDRRVTLQEAYEHAFNHTVRLSTTSKAGVQHPTFRYELRGRQDLVITRFDDDHAVVFAPPRVQLLLFAAGRVVAEVAVDDEVRGLVVAPGSYTVVARTADTLYEGELVVEPGTTMTVALSSLRASAFARLVRKGGGEQPMISGVAAGLIIVSSPLPTTTGLQIQMPFASSWGTVTPRLDLGIGGAWSSLWLTEDEVTQVYLASRLTVMLSTVVDFSWVSLSFGALAGVQSIMASTTRTFGEPHDLDFAIGGVGGVDAAVQIPLLDRWYLEGGVEFVGSTITQEGVRDPHLQIAPRLLLGFWM